MNVASDLRIVGKDHTESTIRNGGLPLSYVECESPTIRLCAEGWKKMIQLKGYVDPERFFASKQGIKTVSFSISHETVHQVLFKIEAEKVSLKLDQISGAGEIV